MNKPELGVRLIEILKDSGLIPQEQLRKALDEHRRTGDSILDILRRDVSFRSIRDLLAYEIPLPFGGGKRQKLKDVLVQSGVITDDELTEALKSEGAEGGDLGQVLISRGLLTEAQLKRAVKQQQQTGLPLWRTLINLNMIDPASITDIMQERLSAPRATAQDELIIDLLFGMKFLTAEQKAEALAHKDKTGELMLVYLVQKGYITPEKVGEAMSSSLDIQFVNLRTIQIDSNVVFSLPENLERERHILPIRREENTLFLAMANPLDKATISRVSMMTGCDVHPLLAKQSDLEQQIEEHYRRTQLLSDVPKIGVAESQAPSEIPAVQLATSIIEGALNARATDIHLEPQLPAMRVRYRIDGRLYDIMSIPQSIEQAVFSRVKILANMDITERRRAQDGHITMRIQGRELNMRISCIPTYLGEKMVIRLLDEANVLRGLKQLGLEEPEETRLRALLEKPYGMILVTGPVGSGKTTTLYASLNELNILQTNIVTIEDPVEYRLAGINQVQVNPVVDMTFATTLRSVLRQDPDVLMVGEIRDSETAKVATWAALTGQLVLATLHTKDTASANTMMMNLGVERFLVASGIVGVVAQRLVRQLCDRCMDSYTPDASVLSQLGLPLDGKYKFNRSLGCDHCHQTGYYGRTGIFEVMTLTSDLTKLVLDGVPDSSIMAAAVKGGMRTLRENGLLKVISGVTTPEEVLREVTL